MPTDALDTAREPFMMAGRPATLAIIGGGIGGLAAAAAPLRVGFDVLVYEQARALGEVGAGINIGPNASRILHRLGLADAWRQARDVRPAALGWWSLPAALAAGRRGRDGVRRALFNLRDGLAQQERDACLYGSLADIGWLYEHDADVVDDDQGVSVGGGALAMCLIVSSPAPVGNGGSVSSAAAR
jgi:glycine/D-amino acid oxidase-like deaminating enzyme